MRKTILLLPLFFLPACDDSSDRPPNRFGDPDSGPDAAVCPDGDGDGHSSEDCGGDDCDDADPAVHPDAEEGPCADVNCDGHGGPDADGDGAEADACGGSDCDDGDAATHAGADDSVGDRTDQNCDGADGLDADGDGAANETSGGDDCDDADASFHPDAPDQVGDAADQDCDGIDGVDDDGDEVSSAASGGTDCDDGDPLIYPAAADVVGDAIDENCDGVDGFDGDGDAFASIASGGDDCNDADPDIRPFAQGDWLWEPLTVRLRGDAPAAALDSTGAVRVAFVEEDAIGVNQIVLATNASGAWEQETVAPSPHCVALALDQDDAVHLVYRDADEVPQYATNASGDWVSGPIGGTSAVANCTVTVAPDGVVHTIFSTDALAVTHGHLTSDGDWVFEEVATGEVETTDVSFAIDSTNTLHVAYSDDGGVHYATTVADVWESDEVDAGQTAHLALQGDLPRIIYQGDPRAFYAELVADEWVLTELPWDAIGPDLTFASDGQAHAAFGDAGTGNVVWARSSGGGWSSEPVQPTEGTEPIGRILMTTDDEPLFLVAQEAGDGAASTLYFVERAPVDGVDDDCDGRVR